LQRRRYAEHTARDSTEYRLTAKGRALVSGLRRADELGQPWTGLPAPPVDLLHQAVRASRRRAGRVLGMRPDIDAATPNRWSAAADQCIAAAQARRTELRGAME